MTKSLPDSLGKSGECLSQFGLWFLNSFPDAVDGAPVGANKKSELST
jgi:hypothetical protein